VAPVALRAAELEARPKVRFAYLSIRRGMYVERYTYRKIYIYIYTHICIHICIYVYIHVCRERENESKMKYR